MKIRESCLQTGNFIYKPGISLTKQDFHLQRESLGLQRGFSGYYLPNKYIYASGGDNGNKIIYDKNGKIIADYSACVNMGADSAFQINDKIYTIFNGGVAYMDLDGKNYGEMMQ